MQEYQLLGEHPANYDNGPLKFADYFSIPPMFFTKNLQEVPYIDRFPNGKAFLISSGPSFANVNKSLLSQPGILTMGLNNSPKSFRPKIWTCVDDPASFLQSIWMDPLIEKIVPISHIEKTLTDSYSTDKLIPVKIRVGDCPNVFYYRRNEVVRTDQLIFEDTINWGNHSKIGGGRSVFLAAIRILYLLGIRHLFLLGVDLKMDKGYYYHFPQDRSKGSINGNNSTYHSMKKWFGEMKDLFQSVGFNIYNCNPDSALKVFKFISVEEAVEMALNGFPKVGIERTDGMYTRKVTAELERKEVQAKKEAKKYTEQQRQEIKEQLDKEREALDIAKMETENQAELITDKLSDNDRKIIKKAISNHLEVKKLFGENADNPIFQAFINAKINEVKIRKKFKDTEIEKNKIWGIVK